MSKEEKVLKFQRTKPRHYDKCVMCGRRFWAYKDEIESEEEWTHCKACLKELDFQNWAHNNMCRKHKKFLLDCCNNRAAIMKLLREKTVKIVE